MYNPKLPNYVPLPPPPPRPATTPRATLNRTASRDIRRAIAGEGTVIPDAYGRVQIAARIPVAVQYQNTLVLLCVWCGPCDAVEAVWLGDEQFSGSMVHYTGTQNQGVDPTLAAAISGYADALLGVSYSVLRLNPEDGSNRIYATVRGRQVYDPRGPVTAYSSNPSLALADYIQRVMGRSVDWATVTECSDANDELLGDSSKRREIGLLMDRQATHEDWLDTLREYAGVFVVWDNPVRLIPDRPRATDHVLGPSQMRDLKPSKRAMDEVPNRVVVYYTDATGAQWKQVPASTPVIPGEPLVESVIRMPGFQNYASAYRFAIERVNGYRLADLDADVEVFDEGLKITEGDVVSLTHPIGLSAKLMRVLSAQAIEPGRWRLQTSEYDPAVYSDATPSAPTYPDTDLPDPRLVPDAPVPVLAEEVYQLQNGTWATRLRINWATVTDYPYELQYLVRVVAGANVVWSSQTQQTEYVTGALQEGVTYTVSIYVIGLGAVQGNAGSDQIIAQGKQLPPGDVPFVQAIEIGGEVRIKWDAAIDVDIWRYEVRYSAPGGDWDAALVIDRVDSLRMIANELPPGDWVIYVKALDSVGKYSLNAASDTVTVTLDAGAFLQGEAYLDDDAGELVNFSWAGNGWVAATAGDTWDALFASTLDSYSNPLLSYRSAGAAEWVSDPLDLQAIAAGTWQARLWASVLTGAYVATLELSDDAIAWTVYNNLSVNASARYARVRITAAGTDVVFVSQPFVHIRCDVIPRVENNTVTTDGTGKATVTLGQIYSRAIAINLQPSGNAPRTAVYDNVQLGDPSEFDIWLFDAAGDGIAGDVGYTFKGV